MAGRGSAQGLAGRGPESGGGGRSCAGESDAVFGWSCWCGEDVDSRIGGREVNADPEMRQRGRACVRSKHSCPVVSDSRSKRMIPSNSMMPSSGTVNSGQLHRGWFMSSASGMLCVLVFGSGDTALSCSADVQCAAISHPVPFSTPRQHIPLLSKDQNVGKAGGAAIRVGAHAKGYLTFLQTPAVPFSACMCCACPRHFRYETDTRVPQLQRLSLFIFREQVSWLRQPSLVPRNLEAPHDGA